MTIVEALAWATDYLTKHKIENARLEAEILLAHALGLKRPSLISQNQSIIASKRLSLFQSYIKRRAHREPIAYIVGYQPFLGLDFFVNPSVLIPRPETELLVEEALKLLTTYSIADIGTGSGCIAITIAKNLPNAKIIGIDSSLQALKLARKNAARHKVSARCKFIQGNLLDRLKEKVDLIISNPPYIPAGDLKTLQPEVREWEPREALDGGEDGLKYTKQLIQAAPQYLKPNGILILEFGFGQAKAIKKIAKENFKEVKIIKDYSGKARILLATNYSSSSGSLKTRQKQ